MTTAVWSTTPKGTAATARWDDHTCAFNIVEPPSSGTTIYWATQLSFYQPDATKRGGAHCGPQYYTSAGTHAVNWGGYDDIVGGGAVFYGSLSPTLTQVAVNDYATYQYPWVSGEPYLFHVFKSPKQNYTSAELYPSGAPDQTAADIAWRCAVTRVSTGETTVIRDIIVPNCATSNALGEGYVWIENFNAGPTTSIGTQCLVTEPRVDNRLVHAAFEITYSTDPNSIQNDTIEADRRGGLLIKTATARTTANGTVLAIPGVHVMSPPTTADTPNDSFVWDLTVDRPLDVAEGRRLIAFCGVEGDAKTWRAPTESGALAGTSDSQAWTRVARFVSGLAGWPYPEIDVFTRVATATEPATYAWRMVSEVDQTDQSSWVAAIAIAVLGPQRSAVSVAAAQDAQASTSWTAPAITDAMHLSRVLWAAMGYSSVATTTVGFTVPGGTLRRASTFTAGDKAFLAVGDVTRLHNARTHPARSGTTDAENNIAAQVAVGPVDVLRPDADVSVGTWTSPPLYTKVNSATVDDTTRISGEAGAVAELALGNPPVGDPGVDVQHRVAVRMRKQSADANTATLTMTVLQGTTVIATHTTPAVPVGDTFLEYGYTLSAAEAAAITDYNDLRVRLTANIT